jgi:16S rRNA (guanine966-N2)-methyltransferase
MNRASNELRIIAGRWRGRRIRFPNLDGLRPTGDRVRETLFNWLQPYLPGARCLDLFAGSGALGLEALSRGAQSVLMVDHSRIATQAIQDSLIQLEVASGSAPVVNADALQFLQGPAERFDIGFLDPPFRSAIINTCCSQLEEGGWLAASAFDYVEQDRSKPLPNLPPGWELYRNGRTAQVAFCLARRIEPPTQDGPA